MDQSDDDEPIRSVVSGAETLDTLIREYMESERNNEIIAEYYPFLQNYAGGGESELDEGTDNFEDAYSYYGWNSTGEAERVRLSTQFVLDGAATFDLNIY